MSNIIKQDITDSLSKSYLEYSMSVIVGRALPDVKDGLKPVHRRILYAMYKMGITSNSAYKKSARIVGDVIGKYHPHGDSSVYEALVRMAQNFSMREPLIDGQGNFGSIDGDNAAAMRYTEARLTKIAEELLKDIEKDTVDFIANYDGTEKEPVVLPARFPNLLVNGSSGIAVGMATNIPPHNLTEIMNALIYLIKNNNATLEEILQFIKGPDFPTGGTIFGKNGILEAYKTGKGIIRIRAKYHIEEKNNKEIIVIDELPYQVNKSKLIKKISNLVKDKVIDGISEVRDESDREGIRIVIELKKDVMNEIILKHLFKHTQMEISFGINMLAIDEKEPKLFNLMEILNRFIKFRKTIVIRRTIYELNEAEKKYLILNGVLIALKNIDDIVDIIKNSLNTKEVRNKLKLKYKFEDIQIQSILDTKLHKLTSLETKKIEEEINQLDLKIKELKNILNDQDKLNEVIIKEFEYIKYKYNSNRKTNIEDNIEEIDMEDLIPNDKVLITITNNGYIKRQSINNYEIQNRGGKGKNTTSFYKEDFVKELYIANNHDYLMFISNKGILYWLKVYKIPEGNRTSKGKAIVNLINLDKDEKIQTIIKTSDFDENKSLIFFTKNGLIKRTNLNEYSNIRRSGIKAINLNENDELIEIKLIDDNLIKEIFVATRNGKGLRTDLNEIKKTGRNSKGFRIIKLNNNDYVVSASIISEPNKEYLLTISENGFAKKTVFSAYRKTHRGGKGVKIVKLNEKTGKLVKTISINENEEKNSNLFILTKNGKLIRINTNDINITNGKITIGVKAISLDDNDKVINIVKFINNSF